MKYSFKVVCMILEGHSDIEYQIQYFTTTAKCALSTVVYP